MLHIYAALAEKERARISAKTKAALAAAKARRVKLGGFRGRARTTGDRAAASRALVTKADARAADLNPIFERLEADWPAVSA
jgi:DNA invertase Pin-like site-specific DNA recombinase